MGTTKPHIEDFAPIMDRIEWCLTACSSLLSYSGRLQLVNSVITPSCLYAMCSIKLHKGVIDNIIRARKQCLWRGNDFSKKGGNLAAWSIVTLPKEKGGLGVLNLKLQNDALLLKHLHKFYAKEDILGSHSYGLRTTLKKFHMGHEKLAPFGGRISSDLTLFTEVLLHVFWVMVPQCCSGRIYGAHMCWLILSPDCFHLQPIHRSQSRMWCKLLIWIASFPSPSLKKLS